MPMNTIYDVDYFIKKFEAIPEENIITGTFWNWSKGKCFLGHCMPVSQIKAAWRSLAIGEGSYKPPLSVIETELAEVRALCLLLNPINPKRGSEAAIAINNGADTRYQQPTPKQRILAALYDVKKAQQPEQGRLTLRCANFKKKN